MSEPCTIGVEISDSECRAAICNGRAGIRLLDPYPFQKAVLKPESDSYRIDSLHSRLDPKTRGGSKEIYVALKHVLDQARRFAPDSGGWLAALAVPGSYTITQREMIRDLAGRAGFSGVALVDISTAGALGSAASLNRRVSVLSVCSDWNSFAAAVVEVGTSTSRGLSLEVSFTCTYGAMWLAAYRAIVESVVDKSGVAWFTDPANLATVNESVNAILSRSSFDGAQRVELGGGVGEVTVSERTFRRWSDPVLDEIKLQVSNAIQGHSPGLVYISPLIAEIPIVANAVAGLVEGAAVTNDPQALVQGALRFCTMFPPDIEERRPAQAEPVEMPAMGRALAIHGEIDRLTGVRRELVGKLSEVHASLSSAYDTAAQMYRAQGRLIEAWEMIRAAVEFDPNDAERTKRFKEITRDIVINHGRHHKFQQLNEFVEQLKKCRRAEGLITQARDYEDYFKAQHFAHCLRNPGSAIRILKELVKRNPRFSEAADYLRELGGNRPR